MPPAKLTVAVPQLSGGRERAGALLRPLLPEMSGAELTLDCTDNVSWTGSFVNEVIALALVTGRAYRIAVVNADPQLVIALWQEARRHGAGDKVVS